MTHQLRFAGRLDAGPFGELSMTRSVSAVTGACLAVRRAVFFEVRGFNEDMKVAFNDIDLCLRLGDHGYRVVWTPFAELFHLECATRGLDSVSAEKQAIFEIEKVFLVAIGVPHSSLIRFVTPIYYMARSRRRSHRLRDDGGAGTVTERCGRFLVGRR